MGRPCFAEQFIEGREFNLSVLAGDLFGRTPIWGSLRAFKVLYYVISFANLGRTLRAMRSRSANIRVEPERMTSG